MQLMFERQLYLEYDTFPSSLVDYAVHLYTENCLFVYVGRYSWKNMCCSVQERRAIFVSERKFGVCIPVTFKEHLNLDCRLWSIPQRNSAYSASSLEIFGL